MQTLHSQYNADFIRHNFVMEKAITFKTKKSNTTYTKKYMCTTAANTSPSQIKKRRASIAIRQISFRSQKRQLLLQMERNAQLKENDLDANARGDESQNEDLVVRRSSTVISSGEISQKQFDVFVADSMTTDYSPSKLFF